MMAYIPADRGKRIGFPDQFKGFPVSPFRDEIHVASRILSYGAGRLAIGKVKGLCAIDPRLYIRMGIEFDPKTVLLRPEVRDHLCRTCLDANSARLTAFVVNYGFVGSSFDGHFFYSLFASLLISEFACP